ncbi:DUF5683 domain-containing protein [Telluribacter humicola]|uniref:DUF5683 domain-containing protein n=1 Tax=Telluribacter humicola TaxID=1720261 RepID=UPI001A973E95|nr:DUF5683 domain-containing protein [Telluribacter humicola]
MSRWLWIGIVALSIGGAQAQRVNTDSLGKVVLPIVKGDTIKPAVDPNLAIDSLVVRTKEKFRPVPRKATIFAIAFPGGGQIYNRDYWKLPLVYGAFGGAVYAIRWNTLRYNDFLTAYKAFYDLSTGKPRTDITTYPVYLRGTDETRELTLDQVKRGRTAYRRYRDYSYVISVAVYALAAVEANVAAHLKTFDISEDLSLRIEPSLYQPNMPGPTAGVRLVFGVR